MYFQQLGNKASTTLASGHKDDLLSPPITMAARMGNVKLVREFISKKVDINSTDSEKKAPIHYAAVQSARESYYTLCIICFNDYFGIESD